MSTYTQGNTNPAIVKRTPITACCLPGVITALSHNHPKRKNRTGPSDAPFLLPTRKRAAPVESATNGSIFFEKLYWEDVGQFAEVVLAVENGVISGSSFAAVNRHLATLDIPDKTVCELGFGLNPQITAPCGYTVLDEKASGTFHIAIGTNRMFGGSNDSASHVDLVGGAFSIGEAKTGGA